MFKLAIVALGIMVAPGAWATIITVNSTPDDVKSDGRCTLRESIIAANKNLPSGSRVGECPAGSIRADIIQVPAGTYTLKLSGANEDNAQSGDLDITDSLTIHGMGNTPDETVIDAQGIDRVFDVFSGDVIIRKLTIQNGKPPSESFGGGIRNQATLSILDSRIMNNSSDSGGGIANVYKAKLTVNSSVIRQNTASSLVPTTGYGWGGGIMNWSGMVDMSHSFISYNNANAGGGIYNGPVPSTLFIFRSTIDSNNASLGGGGIGNNMGSTAIINMSAVVGNTVQHGPGGGLSNAGVAEIKNTTIANNTVSDALKEGGGIYNAGVSPTTKVDYSTISGNVASAGAGVSNHLTWGVGKIILYDTILFNNGDGPECNGTITSHGHNIVGVLDTKCTITETTGDQFNVTSAGLGIFIDSPVAGMSRFPHCGDGIVDGPEECDDGNVTDGDGCSSSCKKEAGGSTAPPSDCSCPN